MTTPNTEPIPATDGDIRRAKRDFAETHATRDGSYWSDFVDTLFARIEHEREMRRELANALGDEVSSCSHLVEDPESCRRLICVMSQRALARAAKMEADYGK